MNNDKAEGKFDQVKGKIKQAVGEAVGDNRLANSGTADQVKGHAKEAWGSAKDTAHVAGNDAEARVRNTTDTHTAGGVAHDVREKIVSTARNVKDAIKGEEHDVRTDRRSA
ncbi:MAG: hypothetical protein NVS9B15_10750 [Acidobacteriaceae bacterium]